MQAIRCEDAKQEWARGWLSKLQDTLYIDGRFSGASAGREKIESSNPADGEKLGAISSASALDVDRAVQAARAAFISWRKVNRRERAEYLKQIKSLIYEHRVELATLEALDNGKLFKEAFEDDLPESADVFEYYAGWTDKYYSETCPVDDGFINYTVREPLGVCALIVPWNFPLLMAAWKMAPALAMGNTVVVKPSPFTSMSLIRLIELIDEKLDFPRGVINLVTGGADTGSYLCEHPQVAKVSFTGSTETGKKIVTSSASSNLKSVSLELGGKSPNIVFADAPDLDFAIERSFVAMFSHKGEKCSEPTRFFIEEKIYDHFLSELVKRAEKVRCGNQFDESAQQGAQCNQMQFDKIMRYIEIGRSEGGKLVAGGERDVEGDNCKGLFIRPTIFTDANNRMRIAQEEIFGPVLVAIPFKSEEQAVEMANDTIYGLAAGLWTSDVSRAHRVAASLDAGMVFVNKYGCYDFASPFGGFKQSGWGKDMAVHSLDSYTKLKSVWLKI